jgi:hypothetical protein
MVASEADAVHAACVATHGVRLLNIRSDAQEDFTISWWQRR